MDDVILANIIIAIGTIIWIIKYWKENEGE